MVKRGTDTAYRSLPTGFAPSGESLSLCLCKEKVTKEKAHPTSGPGCAGVPSLHRRSRGTFRRDVPVPSELSRRPCRSTPSTPIPLGLLRGPGSRPRLLRKTNALQLASGFVVGSESSRGRLWLAIMGTTPPSPSGGRAQALRRGSRGMDAERVTKGQGRPFVTCPRSGAGARAVWARSDQTRMSGWAFFCLLFFAQTKKSEAPEGAQPIVQATPCVTGTAQGLITHNRHNKAPTLEHGRQQAAREARA